MQMENTVTPNPKKSSHLHDSKNGSATFLITYTYKQETNCFGKSQVYRWGCHALHTSPTSCCLCMNWNSSTPLSPNMTQYATSPPANCYGNSHAEQDTLMTSGTHQCRKRSSNQSLVRYTQHGCSWGNQNQKAKQLTTWTCPFGSRMVYGSPNRMTKGWVCNPKA